MEAMTKIKTFKFEVHQLGLLCVEGLDASNFLQGQLTCHLDEINSHISSLGAHCNPQGRIISFFRIFFWRDKYYLHMPKDNLRKAQTALQKYAVFYKVTITDVSTELKAICSDKSFLKMQAPDQNDGSTSDDKNCIIKTENYFLTFGEAEKTLPEINIWEYLQIEAGIPQIHLQTSAKFLPHELNLQISGAIHFGKGCYTGQEIIARMHYRGQLKKHMVHVSTQRFLMSPGMEIAEKFVAVESYVDKGNTSHALVIANLEDLKNFPEFIIHALPYSI
jgi:folate-binding protein YgfZ